jgi:hypothetical protein
MHTCPYIHVNMQYLICTVLSVIEIKQHVITILNVPHLFKQNIIVFQHYLQANYLHNLKNTTQCELLHSKLFTHSNFCISHTRVAAVISLVMSGPATLFLVG